MPLNFCVTSTGTLETTWRNTTNNLMYQAWNAFLQGFTKKPLWFGTSIHHQQKFNPVASGDDQKFMYAALRAMCVKKYTKTMSDIHQKIKFCDTTYIDEIKFLSLTSFNDEFG